MIERVMVFTAVGPRGVEPETAQAILNLAWPGPLRWLAQRDNPHGDNGRDNILHQYRQARQLFLAGDDEAMLVIEADIIPPPKTLLRLAQLDADCAYGVYRFRVSNVCNIFERYPGRPRNEGESLSIHPAKLRQALRAGIVPCSGAGLGCVLIHRHVLEALDFRMEATAHCDTYFNRDVLRGGWRQMADMSVVCGHKNEHGEILWPW